MYLYRYLYSFECLIIILLRPKMSTRQTLYRDTSFKYDLIFSTVPNLKDESRNNIGRVQWKRMEEIYPDAVDRILYKITPNDILPPKYFTDNTMWRIFKHLSTNPQVVQAMFVKKNENKRGEFSVYILKDGKPLEIVVDTIIPVIQDADGRYYPAFVNLNFDNNIPDLWPLLIEKAIAKTFSSISILFSKDFLEQFNMLCFETFHKYYTEEREGGKTFEKRDIFDVGYVISL